MIAIVTYGVVTDMDRRRRCQRCEGTAIALTFLDNSPAPCPRCLSTPGINPEGWGYQVPAVMTPRIGDRVTCPATPYAERPTATVIDLRDDSLTMAHKTLLGYAS